MTERFRPPIRGAILASLLAAPIRAGAQDSPHIAVIIGDLGYASLVLTSDCRLTVGGDIVENLTITPYRLESRMPVSRLTGTLE